MYWLTMFKIRDLEIGFNNPSYVLCRASTGRLEMSDVESQRYNESRAVTFARLEDISNSLIDEFTDQKKLLWLRVNVYVLCAYDIIHKHIIILSETPKRSVGYRKELDYIYEFQNLKYIKALTTDYVEAASKIKKIKYQQRKVPNKKLSQHYWDINTYKAKKELKELLKEEYDNA